MASYSSILDFYNYHKTGKKRISIKYLHVLLLLFLKLVIFLLFTTSVH